MAYYSLQCRVDWIMAVHLPSHTRALAQAVDQSLRRVYKTCYGVDLLDTTGAALTPCQQDHTFTRDLFRMKVALGGGAEHYGTRWLPQRDE